MVFQPNQQIGNYFLIRKIGRGGFGEVWLAERRTKLLTTKVAVKLPLDEQVDLETIKQEATLWEQASGHPNVLPIIEADIYDNQVLIVSEFAPEGSLEDWLKKHGKMSVKQAVETTIKILDGLNFLHSRQIIHRDLKPANILLQGNTPRLTDFGISRALRTTIASQTQNISGTFAYMPPEAFDGKRNAQTDVWAVGVCLYQFLTGNLPFPQTETTALIAKILMTEPVPLPDNVPQSLKDVVSKALAKNPVERYQSAAEIREDLQRLNKFATSPMVNAAPESVIEDLPHSDKIPESVATFVPFAKSLKAGTGTHDFIESTLQSERNRKIGIAFFLVLLLSGLGGIAYFTQFGDNGQPEKNKNNGTSELVQLSPSSGNSSQPLMANSPKSLTNLKPTNANNNLPSENNNARSTPKLNTVTPLPAATTGDVPERVGEDGSPSSKPTPAKSDRESSVDEPLKILSQPQPPYTDAARQNNVQGAVSLRVTFNANGRVGTVTPITSLPSGLTERAIAAAKQIRFFPAKKNGISVSTVKTITYNFKLY